MEMEFEIFYDVSRRAMQLVLQGLLIFTFTFKFYQATGSRLHDRWYFDGKQGTANVIFCIY